MAATAIAQSTRAYEAWLRARFGHDIVENDLRAKHAKMAEGPFPFLRATYWRWAEAILDECPELADAPSVLAVGDIHLENFGTWRDADGRLVWGVNDFDEAADMPYVLDLVRLATSAVLGCPRSDTHANICAHILEGYARGLANPHPIVLDHDYAWLRKLVVTPEKARARFWQKIGALAASRTPAPPSYVRALTRAMPDRRIEMTVRPRTAGAGSLGRPRWIGIAQWRGALVVREAKAVIPSAWTRAGGHVPARYQCHQIATGRYRAPDPWLALSNNIVTRRLSPNNRKIEAAEDPANLVSKKMLRTMGRDLAAIHLGAADRRAVIERDLARREHDWLPSAVERAVALVRQDYKEWRKG